MSRRVSLACKPLLRARNRNPSMVYKKLEEMTPGVHEMDLIIRNPAPFIRDFADLPGNAMPWMNAGKHSTHHSDARSKGNQAVETLPVLGLFSLMQEKVHPGRSFLRESTPVLATALYNAWFSILRRCLLMMPCKGFPGGGIRKEHFPDAHCYGSDGQELTIFAVFGLLLWGVGIPLGIFLRLRLLGIGRLTSEYSRKYGFFLQGLKPTMWWWDIIIKRLDIFFMQLFTYYGVVEDERAKLFLFSFVSATFLAAHNRWLAYDSRSAGLLNAVESYGLSVRFLSFAAVAWLLQFQPNRFWTYSLVLATFLYLMCFQVYFIVHLFSNMRQHFADKLRVFAADDDSGLRNQRPPSLMESESDEAIHATEANREDDEEDGREPGTFAAALDALRLGIRMRKIVRRLRRVLQFVVRKNAHDERQIVHITWSGLASKAFLYADADGKSQCEKARSLPQQHILRKTPFQQRHAFAHAIGLFTDMWLVDLCQNELPSRMVDTIVVLSIATVQLSRRRREIERVALRHEVRYLVQDALASMTVGPQAVRTMTKSQPTCFFEDEPEFVGVTNSTAEAAGWLIWSDDVVAMIMQVGRLRKEDVVRLVNYVDSLLGEAEDNMVRVEERLALKSGNWKCRSCDGMGCVLCRDVVAEQRRGIQSDGTRGSRSEAMLLTGSYSRSDVDSEASPVTSQRADTSSRELLSPALSPSPPAKHVPDTRLTVVPETSEATAVEQQEDFEEQLWSRRCENEALSPIVTHLPPTRLARLLESSESLSGGSPQEMWKLRCENEALRMRITKLSAALAYRSPVLTPTANTPAHSRGLAALGTPSPEEISAREKQLQDELLASTLERDWLRLWVTELAPDPAEEKAKEATPEYQGTKWPWIGTASGSDESSGQFRALAAAETGPFASLLDNPPHSDADDGMRMPMAI
mmetsp:Transcript_66435/g.144790  ORF Transcript_66435/g.144790 Transcript_66435/m.144790 type:complete len:922 (+) Transcript_66435:3-2768(+)